MFNFLDKNGDGKISFPEMLHQMTPGARERDIDAMMVWVYEEDLLKEKGVQNYKNPYKPIN